VRWTGDAELARSLEPNVRAAVGWIDRYGDRDGDGYVEYERRVAETGLDNQCWKDSWDSIAFADGRIAPTPRATCEIQGYVYDAKRRTARLARELYGDPGWAEKLERDAAALKERFNRDFWIEGEGYIAQALDASKRRVEAVTSNPGHCMWAGIVDAAPARAVARRLLAPDLFSGWGLRTLSTLAVNFDERNPANGGVWAHDSAIAAAGLRCGGFVDLAEVLARAVLEAGMAFPHRRIPEFWCGTNRVAGAPPDEHDRSCSPQAWSAAAPFSLLTTLLGLQADPQLRRLRIAPAATPLWRRLEVTGLHFAGHRIDFAIEDDGVRLGAIPRGVEVVT